MGKGSKIKVPKKRLTRDEFVALAQQASDLVQQQRAAAQLASEAIAAGRAEFTAADGTREERLERTRNSALEFGRVYLPHFFEQPSAPFHSALDALLSGNYTDEDIEEWKAKFGIEFHRGDPVLGLEAIEIPRGHGKSVIAVLCDHLRRICHGLDPYMILASDTMDQAASQLEDIKDELESNEKIKADFGNLKPAEPERWVSAELIQNKAGRAVWREGRIVTSNNVRMDAIGRGGKLRGRRHGPKRPTLITGDDLDNDENVASAEQRNKAWNWVISAVEPARDPIRGNVRLIGTCIHFDCVIARAERKTGEDGQRLFTSIKFAALRKNAKGDLESAWPTRFPVEVLLKKKSLLGAAKFGAEYQNDPRDPETEVFTPDRFTYYQPNELTGKDMKKFLYVDPSKGKKSHGRKKSDFSGFAEGYADQEARILYLTNARRKRLAPAAAKAEVTEWYLGALETDPTAELFVEANSFGDILGEQWQDELRKRGADRSVKTLNHSTEKAARLNRLSVRIDTGGVRFPAKWEAEDRRPDWFVEFVDFPDAAYDDTIDAIESLDSVAFTSVQAAQGSSDPEGETARDRAKVQQEGRWLSLSRLRGFGRNRAA